MLVSNGVDLAVVKELLTHKDLTTTQRYAHLLPDAVREAALKSGDLLTPRKRKGLKTKNE
jgi:site-specific recombinase XerD